MWSTLQVYSKAGERFDPQKKGGRFKPEFIWQTNWQEQLKRQEDLERQQAEYRKRQQQGGVKGGTGPGRARLVCVSGQHCCWAVS
jgi:DNA invertase Pin-like site-specific DNA recombinase